MYYINQAHMTKEDVLNRIQRVREILNEEWGREASYVEDPASELTPVVLERLAFALSEATSRIVILHADLLKAEMVLRG